MPIERTIAEIRVYSSEGQLGKASGSAGSMASIEKLINKAIEAARLAPANGFAGPADGYDQTDVGLGLMDRRTPQIDDEARVAVVTDNVEDASALPSVEPEAFRYSEVMRRRAFCSSAGILKGEEGSLFCIEGRVRTVDGKYSLADRVESRSFADVASIPLGTDLGRQVARFCAPAPLPDGERVVVIEPVVIAEFMAAVAPAFERTLVKAGDSFLSDGKRVGADRLHMIDDGLLVGAMETRAFDRRGVPSLDLPLIREGAVGALYQSVEVARELNGRPSGHEGAAGPWPGNLVLRPGTRSRNMIYPELGRYLLLDSRVDDGKAWFNLKTGKLRLQAHFFSGIAGEDPVYVGVHTIQTSFIELWSGIREIANDQRRFGSVDVSTWLVEGLRLS
jgi:predicted Zn-dependent protease